MEENKKDNKKIFLIILICVGVLLFTVGLFFIFKSDDNEIKENPEDKRKQEEKLAKSILTNLNIDDYLSYVFNLEVEVNKNILDVTSDKNMVLYFLANKNLDKYKLSYGNDVYATIVNYNDYLEEHNKVFGVKSNIESSYSDFIFAVSTLPEKINMDYQFNVSDIIDCNISNPSNCFIILGNEYVNYDRVEFSNLSIKNNVVSADLKLYSDSGESEVYLDGSFDFEFEKKGESYIAKSLIITYVADAYNGALVVE